LNTNRCQMTTEHPICGVRCDVGAALFLERPLSAPVLSNDNHTRIEIAEPASPRANLVRIEVAAANCRGIHEAVALSAGPTCRHQFPVRSDLVFVLVSCR